MPCASGKSKLQHPVQVEQMRVKQAEKYALEKENMANKSMRNDVKIENKIDAAKAERLEFLRIMKNDCKDVFKARNISSRDLKEKFRERQEMGKLQKQLEAIPSMESTTGVGRNKARRLHAIEQKQRTRLLTRKEPVVTQRDLDRLKLAAKVVSVDERLDALAKQEKESKCMEREYERTRLRFKEMDDARRREQELKSHQEDLWGAGEKMKVLERAFLAKHEQEEEVKRVNRIILNAKCHAVRDAQVQEKTEIAREERNEQKRLEKIVNESAAQKTNQEDDIERKKSETKACYAREIRKQLSERETMRFLEAELIEQEAQMLRQANEAIKRDEQRQRQLARERRAKFCAELNSVLEMGNLFKRMLCEQEREAEMRIAAYLKAKNERERALATERQVSKEAYERNQQRIFTLAQKILESKNQREELGYLREQERIEREYRRKEKEAVMRKKQLEHDLAEARELQLRETKHRQALQIAREEKDFNTLIALLKKDEEKQRKQDDERDCRRRCYRSEIIKQMGDKELERRRLKEFEIDQAAAWRESERQRDANIQAVINAKLQAMRDACLPEKYIRDVERQMQKIKVRR